MTMRRNIREYLMKNVEDLRNPYFYVELLVEFILCAFVLTIVIWALTTLNPLFYIPSTTHFGLFAGFIVMTLVEGYGPLCGCGVNPAAVWGFLVAGRISLVRAIFFMVVEIAGAAAGGMIGYELTPLPQQQTYRAILPGPGITAGMGMAIEGILAFNLMVVALSCTDPTRKIPVMMPSFPIGFCIGTGIMAAGSYTGGLGNPIIPFGPAVATKNFTMHFQVYWAGPFIGATVGAIFYSLVTTAKKQWDTREKKPSPEGQIPQNNNTQSQDRKIESGSDGSIPPM